MIFGHVHIRMEIILSLNHLDICIKHLDIWLNCAFLDPAFSQLFGAIQYLSSKHIKSTFLSLFAHLLLPWLLASFYAGRHQFSSLFWSVELVHKLKKKTHKETYGTRKYNNNALIIHCFLSQSQALHNAKLVMYFVLFSWFCVPLAI